MTEAMMIMDLSGGNPISLDIETTEDREDEAEAPKYQAESGAFLSGAVIDGPTKYELEGMVTASPSTGVPGIQRAIDIRDALIRYKEARQPVTLSGVSIFDVVLITKVKGSIDAKTGKAMKIAISAQSYREVTPGSTTMPPARFKPAVKPGAVAKPSASLGGIDPFINSAIETPAVKGALR